MASTSSSRLDNALSLLRAITVAGLAISVIGGVEFVIFFWFSSHITPVGEYQYIAANLMGPSAFAGGYTTALIGVLLHFAISFVVAAVFLVAAAYIRFLRRFALPAAMVYGIVVNLIMGMVVLPMSAAPKASPTLALILNGMVGDAFFIGLPLAIVVWWNTHTVAVSPKAWMNSRPQSVAAA